MELHIGCDENLTVTGTVDATDGTTYLNSGTWSYVINDSAGTQVTGGSGTLSYVAASNGNYRGVIDAAVTTLLTNGALYQIVLTFVQTNYDDKRYLDCTAVLRGAV